MPTSTPTIADLATQAGFDFEVRRSAPTAVRGRWQEFSGWDADCPCGRECRLLLDAARPFYEAVDPAARGAVWAAVVKAMSIVCLK